MSADGRYVAFDSSGNLVGGVDNHKDDVFVRDISAGTTRQLSRNSAGQQGDRNSRYPAISPDGRVVIFNSSSTNPLPGGVAGEGSGYLANLRTGSLVRLEDVGAPVALSTTGRYAAYTTYTSLVPGDGNATADAYVHDFLTGANDLISQSTAGVIGNDESGSSSISPDGRYVAFASRATNLVPGTPTFGPENVYLRDRVARTTTLVSATPAGVPTMRDSYGGSLSADGRSVAFESYSGKLVPDDTNGLEDGFVRDLG